MIQKCSSLFWSSRTFEVGTGCETTYRSVEGDGEGPELRICKHGSLHRILLLSSGVSPRPWSLRPVIRTVTQFRTSTPHVPRPTSTPNSSRFLSSCDLPHPRPTPTTTPPTRNSLDPTGIFPPRDRIAENENESTGRPDRGGRNGITRHPEGSADGPPYTGPAKGFLTLVLHLPPGPPRPAIPTVEESGHTLAEPDRIGPFRGPTRDEARSHRQLTVEGDNHPGLSTLYGCPRSGPQGVTGRPGGEKGRGSVRLQRDPHP